MGKELFPSFRDCFASVLAVKGALRRAKKRRALDRCGPLRTRSTMEGMGGIERPPHQAATFSAVGKSNWLCKIANCTDEF
jgi:hypothetical protein